MNNVCYFIEYLLTRYAVTQLSVSTLNLMVDTAIQTKHDSNHYQTEGTQFLGNAPRKIVASVITTTYTSLYVVSRGRIRFTNDQSEVGLRLISLVKRIRPRDATYSDVYVVVITKFLGAFPEKLACAS